MVGGSFAFQYLLGDFALDEGLRYLRPAARRPSRARRPHTRRLPDRGGVQPLVGEGASRRQVHRRDLQFGKRRRRSGRRMVRSQRARRGARCFRQAQSGRGDDLVEEHDHGARAIRWRRRGAPAAPLQRLVELGPPGTPVRRELADPLSHLVLFGFIYPGERALIPSAVVRDLVNRLLAELEAPTRDSKVCQGTLLSRGQYLVDIDEWGYDDPRIQPRGSMTEDQIADWTAAIDSSKD